MHVVDLHNHTPYVTSDYKAPGTTPSEYVSAALDAGIDVLAVTDHVGVSWWPQVAEAAEERAERTGERLCVLPGCELKVRWAGDEAHLVSLLPPAEALDVFGELVARLGVADQLGDVTRLPYVTVHRDPVEVVRAVDDLGGMCHVGHIDRYFGSYRLLGTPTLERLLAEAPLSAAEVLDLAAAEEIARLAPGLIVIRSSDAHSPDEMGRRTTTLPLREASFDGLREALFAGRS